jgi:glycosyltransferase involved in cell wall biosynthesis
MKVLVDARIYGKSNGGVEQALLALAGAFAESNFEDIEFFWLLTKNNQNELMENLPINSKVFFVPEPQGSNNQFKWIVDMLRSNSFGDIVLKFLRKNIIRYSIEPELEIVKECQPDLIHFPTQFGFATNIPNVYQPHDMQHLHYPHFFSKEALYLRTIAYTQMINQSTFVVVGNEWTKNDVQDFYPESRVLNVPVSLQPLKEVVVKEHPNSISEPYIYYPASTWVHKNHEKLFEAFDQLKLQFQDLKLVLSGAGVKDDIRLSNIISKSNFRNDIIREGFVSEERLVDLYKNAQCVVMPSLFESESLPVWEAFKLGTPVAASFVTAIPAQVGDAALLFDPMDSSEIANVLVRILEDEKLRVELSARGLQRVSLLSNANSALGYRYAYRRALGFDLDQLDSQWTEKGFKF